MRRTVQTLGFLGIMLWSALTSAEGPFSFTAIPGRNADFHSLSAGTGPTQFQSLSLRLNTGNAGVTFTAPSQHFAFSVRGPNEVTCPPDPSSTTPRVIRFAGRGIAVYPYEKVVAFENFTGNCQSGTQLVAGTERGISIDSNSQYYINVWANHFNVWYEIEAPRLNRAGEEEWILIGSGDCRSQAASSEADECGEWVAPDPAYKRFLDRGNQTWIGHTHNSRSWSVTDWHSWHF